MKPLGDINQQKVAIFGDAMLDRYTFGRVDRISPESPVPVVFENKLVAVLGGAVNVSRNLADFGVSTRTISLLGRPSEDTELLKLELSKLEEGLAGLVYDLERPTTTKMRVLGNGQQIVRIDRESVVPVSGECAELLEVQLEQLAGSVSALIVADYAKGVVTEAMVDRLRRISASGLLVAVDPNPKNPQDWSGVDIFKPNFVELKEISGGDAQLCAGENPLENSDLIRMMNQVYTDYRLKHLLVTLSEHGMVYFGPEGLQHWEPTQAQEVFDVSGAGDTVISYFTLAIAAGWSGVEATKLANVAAGLVVKKLGTASLTREELTVAWESYLKE